jgi:hypothetical protein
MGCWPKIVRGLARQPAFTEPDKGITLSPCQVGLDAVLPSSIVARLPGALPEDESRPDGPN